uniref:Cns1/TTC4 wheel domain-containing protein n=1 Tax=Pinguiococcus pyrenoidosus TaxID=172671 RepID=A0A7R9Y8L8_9STRA
MAVDINAFIEESLAAGRGWESEEARQAYLDRLENEKFALFAEDASEMTQEDIDAFNNMIYDDRTPLERMRNFRDHGNRHFATGKRNKMYFRDAIIMYGKALQESQQLESEYSGSEEGKQEISKLWSNAAAANLSLRNWGSALKAADAAIDLWDGNVKAYYRKCKALVQLRRYSEAVVAATGGLALDPDNAEMQKLQKQAREKFKSARQRDQAKAAALLRRQQPIVDLWELAQTYGVLLAAPDKSLDEASGGHALGRARPRWHEEGDVRDVAWPMLFLYPEYGQTDLIQDALGQDQLVQWMGRLLPEEEEHLPGWDERRDYRGSNVDVFFKINAAFPVEDQDELLQAYGVSQPGSDRTAADRKPKGVPGEDRQAWVQIGDHRQISWHDCQRARAPRSTLPAPSRAL